MKKMLAGILAVSCVVLVTVKTPVYATSFDPAYYGSRYPDVVNVLGTDPQKLYNHYLTYGMKEGRTPYEGASKGEKVDGIFNTKVPENSFVALSKLANYSSLKKKMTDAEFQSAYNAALNLVSPLAGKTRDQQLIGIQQALRKMFDDGKVAYSTASSHYNDPYGYFVDGAASCAGCARATGLCLNILGIPYEHVNENQWSHQWCRVNIDGVYWICDPYGLYCGPEPEAYKHPYLQ